MKTKTNGNDGQITSIQYMRGIACIFVVLIHYGFYLNNTFFFGVFGVDLFFIISGFIITLATTKKIHPITFLKKRFFRIYPTFIIVWIFAVCAIYNNESLTNIIRSLFLLHRDYNWHSAPGYGWNMIGPPWTLTYEFLFYFIFAFAMFINHKHRVIICSGIIIASVILLQFLYNQEFSLDSYISAKLRVNHTWQILVKLLSTTMLFEFIAGMALAAFYKHIQNINSVIKLILSITFLCLSLSLFIRFPDSKLGMHGFFWHSVFLFTGLLLLEQWISNRKINTLSFIGEISYPLYLIHFPVMLAYRKIFPEMKTQNFLFGKFLIIIITSIIIAALLHIYIERPFMKRKKELIKT